MAGTICKPPPDTSASTEVIMAQEPTANASAGAGERRTVTEHLAAIEEQGRVTLELVRTLVGLLLPKAGDREGLSLEDLLAAVISQQRDLLVLARATRSEVQQLGESLPFEVAEALGTTAVRTRGARPC
jgi:hypothetical protein